MNEAVKNDQAQFCPQCGKHCPVDALRCGKGRRYFGITEADHELDHGGHSQDQKKDGLAGLLHQCGRFVRHTDLNEDELFQPLTDEEKASLQAALEKLAASWRERCGEEGFGSHKDKKRHKHGGYEK